MTIKKTARFVVEPDRLAEAVAAIEKFVAHARREVGTLVYQSWRSRENPNRFLHLMEFQDASAEDAHTTSEAVRAFTEALYPLCSETPTFEEWETTR